jgi:predicted transcriptional regulator
MTIKHLIIRDKESIAPFVSIESIEEKLLEKGHLVVKNNAEFLGILTFPDIVKQSHNLVIDCLVPKKRVMEQDDLQHVYDLMKQEKQHVLPVFDKSERFVGCVAYADVLRESCSLIAAPVEVRVENVIGDDKTEVMKHDFIKELYHNTKNPIQVIYSAIDMIDTSDTLRDKKLMLQNIRKNTKKIDDIINGLYLKYFFPP